MEASLREFYEHVYPVELVTQWLSYDIEDTKAAEGGRTSAKLREGYLSRREFCFTLKDDIFTRFRSYGSAAELRAELIRCAPEKIDVGAVYNIRPNQKQNVANVLPVERELVFDIDMSDYDNVRSCCTGKQICTHCWTWMSCAAHVLRSVLEEDFGFTYILPVYSGRRGVHLWVCDKRARGLHDDERAALVGYLTVVAPKTLRSSVVTDLASHRPIHPTIRHLLEEHIEPAFAKLFVNSGTNNPNNVAVNPKAASIVYEAITAVLKAGSRDALNRFTDRIVYSPGNVLDWHTVLQALGTSEREARDVLQAVTLLLMYPRLDENVSTHRDHLLKLPFCIHPGTGSLCCPLEWTEVDSFDPVGDAPDLKSILLERHIDPKWERPLVNMLERMSADEEEKTVS